MATFKIGDRVRIKKNVTASAGAKWALGMETTIIDYGRLKDWQLALVGPSGSHIYADLAGLEPILPPDEKADAFIERTHANRARAVQRGGEGDEVTTIFRGHCYETGRNRPCLPRSYTALTALLLAITHKRPGRTPRNGSETAP